MAYNLESEVPGSLFPHRGLGLRTRALHGRTPGRSAKASSAVPDDTLLDLSPSTLALAGLLGAVIVGLSVMWYVDLSRPLTCRPAPLAFQIGADADTQMTIRAGAQCAVYVLPGQATLDEPLTTTAPMHGTLTTRGHSGIDYRPDSGFTGEDEFAVAMNGRLGQRTGSMDLHVHVAVR